MEVFHDLDGFFFHKRRFSAVLFVSGLRWKFSTSGGVPQCPFLVVRGGGVPRLR